MKYPRFYTNAENFIEVAKNYGLEVVSYPVEGGIMVWQKGSTLEDYDGAGHVAVVERVYDSNHIYTSESAYAGTAFYNSHRYNSNGRWGMGSGYSFRGCIVNPAVGKGSKPTSSTPAAAPTELNGYTNTQLACMVWEGRFGSGETRKQKLGSRYNAVQDLVDNYIGQSKSSDATCKSLSDEVWRGEWGNGQDRINRLTKAGFSASKVQGFVDWGNRHFFS